MKELAPGFGRTLLERHGKGAQRLLEMWQGLKPGLFLRAFSARLKSCPVTKLASVEFLRQTETLARHPNSNAIALVAECPVALSEGEFWPTARPGLGSPDSVPWDWCFPTHSPETRRKDGAPAGWGGSWDHGWDTGPKWVRHPRSPNTSARGHPRHWDKAAMERLRW